MHNLVAIAYVISGILFITALRGLSSPESSRRGNVLGIIGMFIAVAATLVSVDFFNLLVNQESNQVDIDWEDEIVVNTLITKDGKIIKEEFMK